MFVELYVGLERFEDVRDMNGVECGKDRSQEELSLALRKAFVPEEAGGTSIFGRPRPCAHVIVRDMVYFIHSIAGDKASRFLLLENNMKGA